MAEPAAKEEEKQPAADAEDEEGSEDEDKLDEG